MEYSKNAVVLSVAALATIALVAVGVSPTLVAAQSSNSDDEEELDRSREALEDAEDAAIDYVGDGRVTNLEINEDDGYYEVEVTRENDDVVTVFVDEDFDVIRTEGDDDDLGRADDDDENEDEDEDDDTNTTSTDADSDEDDSGATTTASSSPEEVRALQLRVITLLREIIVLLQAQRL